MRAASDYFDVPKGEPGAARASRDDGAGSGRGGRAPHFVGDLSSIVADSDRSVREAGEGGRVGHRTRGPRVISGGQRRGVMSSAASRTSAYPFSERMKKYDSEQDRMQARQTGSPCLRRSPRSRSGGARRASAHDLPAAATAFDIDLHFEPRTSSVDGRRSYGNSPAKGSPRSSRSVDNRPGSGKRGNGNGPVPILKMPRTLSATIGELHSKRRARSKSPSRSPRRRFSASGSPVATAFLRKRRKLVKDIGSLSTATRKVLAAMDEQIGVTTGFGRGSELGREYYGSPESKESTIVSKEQARSVSARSSYRHPDWLPEWKAAKERRAVRRRRPGAALPEASFDEAFGGIRAEEGGRSALEDEFGALKSGINTVKRCKVKASGTMALVDDPQGVGLQQPRRDGNALHSYELDHEFGGWNVHVKQVLRNRNLYSAVRREGVEGLKGPSYQTRKKQQVKKKAREALERRGVEHELKQERARRQMHRQDHGAVSDEYNIAERSMSAAHAAWQSTDVVWTKHRSRGDSPKRVAQKKIVTPQTCGASLSLSPSTQYVKVTRADSDSDALTQGEDVSDMDASEMEHGLGGTAASRSMPPQPRGASSPTRDRGGNVNKGPYASRHAKKACLELSSESATRTPKKGGKKGLKFKKQPRTEVVVDQVDEDLGVCDTSDHDEIVSETTENDSEMDVGDDERAHGRQGRAADVGASPVRRVRTPAKKRQLVKKDDKPEAGETVSSRTKKCGSKVRAKSKEAKKPSRSSSKARSLACAAMLMNVGEQGEGQSSVWDYVDRLWVMSGVQNFDRKVMLRKRCEKLRRMLLGYASPDTLADKAGDATVRSSERGVAGVICATCTDSTQALSILTSSADLLRIGPFHTRATVPSCIKGKGISQVVDEERMMAHGRKNVVPVPCFRCWCDKTKKLRLGGQGLTTLQAFVSPEYMKESRLNRRLRHRKQRRIRGALQVDITNGEPVMRLSDGRPIEGESSIRCSVTSAGTRKITVIAAGCLYAHMRRFTKRLFVAGNRLRSCDGLDWRWVSLESLSLADNDIADVEGLKNLVNLTSLTDLTLKGNPICRLPRYRAHVISLLEQLKTLDGVPITAADRVTVAKELVLELQQIDLLLKNFFTFRHLRMADQKMRLHADFYRSLYGSPSMLHLKPRGIAVPDALAFGVESVADADGENASISELCKPESYPSASFIQRVLLRPPFETFSIGVRVDDTSDLDDYGGVKDQQTLGMLRQARRDAVDRLYFACTWFDADAKRAVVDALWNIVRAQYDAVTVDCIKEGLSDADIKDKDDVWSMCLNCVVVAQERSLVAEVSKLREAETEYKSALSSLSSMAGTMMRMTNKQLRYRALDNARVSAGDRFGRPLADVAPGEGFVGTSYGSARMSTSGAPSDASGKRLPNVISSAFMPHDASGSSGPRRQHGQSPSQEGKVPSDLSLLYELPVESGMWPPEPEHVNQLTKIMRPKMHTFIGDPNDVFVDDADDVTERGAERQHDKASKGTKVTKATKARRAERAQVEHSDDMVSAEANEMRNESVGEGSGGKGDTGGDEDDSSFTVSLPKRGTMEASSGASAGDDCEEHSVDVLDRASKACRMMKRLLDEDYIAQARFERRVQEIETDLNLRSGVIGAAVSRSSRRRRKHRSRGDLHGDLGSVGSLGSLALVGDVEKPRRKKERKKNRRSSLQGSNGAVEDVPLGDSLGSTSRRRRRRREGRSPKASRYDILSSDSLAAIGAFKSARGMLSQHTLSGQEWEGERFDEKSRAATDSVEANSSSTPVVPLSSSLQALLVSRGN